MPDEKIPILLPTVAREKYPGMWAVVVEYLPTLTESQMAVVVSILVDAATQATMMAIQTARIQGVKERHGLQ